LHGTAFLRRKSLDVWTDNSEYKVTFRFSIVQFFEPRTRVEKFVLDRTFQNFLRSSEKALRNSPTGTHGHSGAGRASPNTDCQNGLLTANCCCSAEQYYSQMIRPSTAPSVPSSPSPRPSGHSAASVSAFSDPNSTSVLDTLQQATPRSMTLHMRLNTIPGSQRVHRRRRPTRPCCRARFCFFGSSSLPPPPPWQPHTIPRRF
jgi:hypothetical protein